MHAATPRGVEVVVVPGSQPDVVLPLVPELDRTVPHDTDGRGGQGGHGHPGGLREARERGTGTAGEGRKLLHVRRGVVLQGTDLTDRVVVHVTCRRTGAVCLS